MLHELLYTSAPRGLRASSTGYCTVAHTADLPDDLIKRLEGLSRYRHLVKGADPVQNGNPVTSAHTRLEIGYRTHHVLSRIGDTGFDHTNRSNYLAHHVVLADDALPACGPAWLIQHANWFAQEWAVGRAPEVFAARLRLPSGSGSAARCAAWERLTGDAGWAGVLAGATAASTPAYLVFAPGQDVLPLLVEALALLDPAERWQITFSTYYTGVTAGTACQWRCVPADSPEAKEAIQARRGVVLRLDQPMSGSPEGELVDAARTGILPTSARATPVAPVVATPARRPAAAPKPVARSSSIVQAQPLELPPDEPLEVIAPPARAGRAEMSVFALILGLGLGGLLMAVAGGLFEIGVGRSPLRVLGQVSTDERALVAKNEELASQANQAKQLAEDRSRDLDRLKQAEGATTKAAEAAVEAAKKETEKTQTQLKAVNKELESAKAAVESLTKEKEALEAKLKKPADPKPVPEIKKPVPADKPKDAVPPPVVIHETNVAPPLSADEIKAKKIFDVPHTGKIKLEAVGLNSNITVKSENEGTTLKLTRPGEPTFQITLTADNTTRAVTLSGVYTEKTFPYLGLAIIKATSENQSAHFQQLFKPKELTQLELTCEDAQPKSEAFYPLSLWPDKLGLFPAPLATELSGFAGIGAELCLGRTARVECKIDGKDKKIALTAAKNAPLFPPPTTVETSEKKAGEPTAELSLKDGKLLLKLTAAANEKLPMTIKLHDVTVGRPIAELKTVQTLLRVK